MGKVSRHVEGRTREARIAVRKKLGSLQSLTVQSRTKKRYEAARQGFYSFLKANSLTLPSKREELDPLVSEFIEHLWASGEGRVKANDAVAGLQDLDPKLRGQLPASWRLLKTWSQNEVPNRAPPLPEGVVHAMVGHALLNNQENFALSLLLGFLLYAPNRGTPGAFVSAHFHDFPPNKWLSFRWVLQKEESGKGPWKVLHWELWMFSASFGNGN